MLKNYIKIAWRNLRKNKTDSLISIGGLSIGLACCILLISFVRFEWSQDNFHENSDRIFRIADESKSPRSGEINKSLITPYPLSTALESNYPEIDKVMDIGGSGIHYEKDGKFIQQRVLLADPGFFEVFTFPLLYGEPGSVLSGPDDIVLTEEMARRIFNREQVVGETLNIRLGKEVFSYTVSGVAEAPPKNSSIQFEMVLPYDSRFRNMDPDQAKTFRESWYVGAGETWVVLNEGASAKELEAKFPELLKTNLGSFAENRSQRLWLQPLDEAYFNQEYQSGITGNTNVLYSLILAGIAIVILAIAGINFMSLTLSRAVGRGHEIGIRKSVGALRNQVSFQLIGEVLLTCSISLLFGLVLAELFSPVLQHIVAKPIDLGIINQPVLWLTLAGILLLLTILTGTYPALKMSGKKATELFSSQRTAERIPVFVKGLICVQFALTISFLITTFVMQQQLNYLFSKDLGFSSSNVIAIELNLRGEDATKTAELFKQEAQRIAGVQQVALTAGYYRDYSEYGASPNGFGMASMGSSTTLEGFEGMIRSEDVDENYIETMGIELLKGQNFSLDRPSELKDGIIVNQKFVQKMGWDNPIGQIIKDDAETWQAPFDGKKVIGVVEDYHFKPLYTELRPMALKHISARDRNIPGTILVKNATANLSETLQKLSNLWDEVIPEETFNYAFLDDMVAQQYQEEKRWSSIMKLSSAMAIILACFGLFGLAALAAQRRTKEIGIRKVLGATITNIVGLLSKDFVTLVVIGFVIAVPIAYYTMNQWLADFAYIFLLAGATALVIALATVSWQSVRAALANPVDSLRSE